MKLSELKNHFKNKYVIRIVAGVLTVALIGSGVTICSGRKVANAAVSSETEESTESSDSTITLEDMVTKSESEVDKEETVYLLTDANGTVNQTIAIEHLYNTEGAATLTDKTKLTNITNVKGKETFEQNGEEITWQADGNDIYYRGTTTDEPPVSQKVTYYLDGEEIAPKDLAGKSGKVTIRYDYENKSTYTANVNGEDVAVNVPFTAITALMLDDNFSNIEVTNGKVKQNGTTNVVIGYALPGLKDSLDVEDNEFSGDIDLPDYFEVTADVENFSLETAMTIVMNATELTDVSGLDTSSLDDTIDDLEDASKQLEDGSGELADGLDTLKNSLGDFVDGMKALSDGLSGYTDGANQINDGLGQVKDGVDTLNNSKKTLSSGVTKLKNGADSAADGAKQLVAGYKGDGTENNPGLLNGTKSLSSGAKTLASGIDTLAEGIQGDGTAENPGLLNGTKSLSSGAKSLASGIDSLTAGFAGDGTAENPGLVSGTKSLADGAGQLADGIKQVAAGFAGDGTAENPGLVNGAQAVAQGASDLNAGVNTMVDSLQEMQTELSQNAANILAQINTTENKALLGQLDASYADGVTMKNIGEVTSKVAAGKGTLVAVIQASTGCNEAQATTQYEALYAGLSQAQGALSVISQVAGGLEENSEDIEALVTGSGQLSTAAASVSAGTSKLAAGVDQLNDGADDLSSGASTVYAGVTTMYEGAKKLDSGSDDLSDGASTIYNGVKSLNTGVKKLDSGSDDLSDGASTIYSGVKKLSNGTSQLSDGLDQLDSGLGSLSSKMPDLVKGVGALKTGVDQLASGSDQLVSNNSDLLDGMKQLLTGTGDIVDGVDQLADGSNELADGMAQFNEEAIDKLVNSYNGDVKDLVDRIQAVLDAGRDYQTYSGMADGQTGSVKFIYKQDAIKSEK